jgi:hypothetical protein
MRHTRHYASDRRPSGLGDVAPGVPVEAGAGHEFGQEAPGLAGEAGGQGEGGQVVAGPGAAALGELAKRVAGEAVGVVAAVRSLAGPERRRRQTRCPSGEITGWAARRRPPPVPRSVPARLRSCIAPFRGCLPPAARAGGSRRLGLRARIRRPGRRTGEAPAR